MQKLFLYSIILLISIFNIANVKADTKPRILKFSHVNSDDSPKGKAAKAFAKTVEIESEGSLLVNIYSNSTLYKDNDEMEALQLEAVHIIAPSFSKFSAIGLKDFEVFDLPYLIENINDVKKLKQGLTGKILTKQLAPKDINLLGFWQNGFKVFTSNKPLNNHNNIKGLKVRIQPSKIMNEQILLLKATPQPTPFSSLPEYIRANLADAQENTPSNIVAQDIHQYHKHLTITEHGYLGYAVLINTRTWKTLSEKQQQAINKAVIVSTQVAEKAAIQDNELALEKLKKHMQWHQLTSQEKLSWKNTLAPAYTNNKLSKDILEAVKYDLKK